jgi:hypothetical protein
MNTDELQVKERRVRRFSLMEENIIFARSEKFYTLCAFVLPHSTFMYSSTYRNRRCSWFMNHLKRRKEEIETKKRWRNRGILDSSRNTRESTFEVHANKTAWKLLRFYHCTTSTCRFCRCYCYWSDDLLQRRIPVCILHFSLNKPRWRFGIQSEKLVNSLSLLSLREICEYIVYTIYTVYRTSIFIYSFIYYGALYVHLWRYTEFPLTVFSVPHEAKSYSTKRTVCTVQRYPLSISLFRKFLTLFGAVLKYNVHQYFLYFSSKKSLRFAGLRCIVYFAKIYYCSNFAVGLLAFL